MGPNTALHTQDAQLTEGVSRYEKHKTWDPGGISLSSWTSFFGLNSQLFDVLEQGSSRLRVPVQFYT